MVISKLSYCKCIMFAVHHSSSLSVHTCISFTRAYDFVGEIIRH